MTADDTSMVDSLAHDAATFARRHPRERVTFVSSSLDGPDGAVAAARRAGVETVTGDIDAIVGERRFTDLREVAPRPVAPDERADPVPGPESAPPSRSANEVDPGTSPTSTAPTGRWLAIVALVGLAGIALRILVLRSPAREYQSKE